MGSRDASGFASLWMTAEMGFIVIQSEAKNLLSGRGTVQQSTGGQADHA